MEETEEFDDCCLVDSSTYNEGIDILNDELSSPIFNNLSLDDDMLPTFLRSELEFGDILGSGTFGLVREVKSIKISTVPGNVTKNELAFDLSNSKVKSRNDVSDPRLSFAIHRRRSGNSVSSRELASDMCIRNGDARFAVKYLMVEDMCEDQRLRARIDLAIEVNYLKVLSHPHVVKVRGVMKTNNPFHPKFFFLMDKLYGTLHDKIVEWDKVQRRKRFNVKHLFQKAIGVKKCQSFTNDFMKQRLYIAHDIATALRYMHSKRVIHRDIKRQNLGFDIRGNIKLFDFGLAKSLREDRLSDSELYNLTAKVGSVPYIAPEVTLGKPYNEKCDVFSFAILLYEIVSLKQPYNLATKKDYFRKVVQGEKRPSIKSWWPMMIKEALKSSWSASPEERPSMKVICKLLHADLEIYDTEENVLSRMEHIANASWHSSKEYLDFDPSDIAE